MTILELLVLALIAAIAGSIGQAIAGFYFGGCIVSAIVGFIGAFLGAWIADQFTLPELLVINIGGEPFPLIWAIIGSALFVFIISLLMPRRAAAD